MDLPTPAQGPSPSAPPPAASLTLPLAPSANRYWRNVDGRMLLSREARLYKKRVAEIAGETGVRPIEGPVVVHLDVYRARRVGDLDNSIKCCFDALQGCLYDNDSQIVEIHARRFDDKESPRVEVRVEPAGIAQLTLLRTNKRLTDRTVKAVGEILDRAAKQSTGGSR